jgi:hypothetical protein
MGQPVTQKQIDELYKRIEELERRPLPMPPTYIPYPVYPQYIPRPDHYPFGYPKVICGGPEMWGNAY